MKRPSRMLMLVPVSLLLLTGCSSFLTNAVSPSETPSTAVVTAAPDFDASLLPVVTEQEYVTALTAAYTTFLGKRGDDAIIIAGEPVGESYGEGVTTESTVNPDGTYVSTTSLLSNGTTTVISSLCTDATTCYVSTDNGMSWLQGVGSGNDWSPANRVDTALLIVNPDGTTTGTVYRMDTAAGQYSIEAKNGIPRQNTIFTPTTVTDYKTITVGESTVPTETVTTTSFGPPAPVETPENILAPATAAPSANK